MVYGSNLDISAFLFCYFYVIIKVICREVETQTEGVVIPILQCSYVCQT
jgi:hypothetical protein